MRIRWKAQVGIAGEPVRRRDGRALAFTVLMGGTGLWIAFAVEGPAMGEPTVEDLLGDHGHQYIGEFRNDQTARRACVRFARQWASGVELEQCTCEEIKAPAAETAMG